MAPHIAVPADLAERYPGLAAELLPRRLQGRVTIRPGAISTETCRAILATTDRWHLPRDSGVMLPAGPGGEPIEVVRSDYKSRQDAPLDGRFREALGPVLWACGFPAPRLDRVLVSTYGVCGHFSWHRDDMLPGTERRETAISIALNDPDEYEGGALELPEAGLSIRPPAGTAVAFPASALHRVTPVSAGVRHVLLTFILKEPE